MTNRLAATEPIVPVIQFTPQLQSKQVATSAKEVTKLKLVSTGGAAHVSVYDNRDGKANSAELVWVLDASQQTNDTDDFVEPLRFKKGIFLTLDDGSGFNPQVCIAFVP